MKRKLIMKIVIPTIILISITGCRSQRLTTPLSNKITNQNLSSKDIREIITYTADKNSWSIINTIPGKITAMYKRGKHIITVDILYTDNNYIIKYNSSEYLRYNGNSIHPYFNKIVNDFNIKLEKNLKDKKIIKIAQNKIKEYEKTQNKWIGRKVSELMEKFGPPINIVKNGAKGEILVYQNKITSEADIITHDHKIKGLSITPYSNNMNLAIGSHNRNLKGKSIIKSGRKFSYLKYYYVDKNNIIYKWKDDIREI